jgi:hypothetical protein
MTVVARMLQVWPEVVWGWQEVVWWSLSLLQAATGVISIWRLGFFCYIFTQLWIVSCSRLETLKRKIYVSSGKNIVIINLKKRICLTRFFSDFQKRVLTHVPNAFYFLVYIYIAYMCVCVCVYNTPIFTAFKLFLSCSSSGTKAIL